MKRIISLVLTIVILVSACSSSGTGATFTRAGSPPESLDLALVSSSASFEIAINNFSGIYTVNSDGSLRLDGAESVTMSDDGLTYTVKLKKGLKWVNSDGEEMDEVTASDYLFTYERILTPETEAVMSYLFEGIIVGAKEMLNGESSFSDVGIKALDDYTLEYKLNYQAPYFEGMLAFATFYPQPKAAFDEYGTEYGTDATKIWYNGPFYTNKYEPEYEITQMKNDLFWDADTVQLASVVFRVMLDLDTMKQAYQSNEIDFFTTSDENVYEQGIDGQEIKDQLKSYSAHISMNTESDYLSDIDLREALYYGFDREAVLKGFSGEVNNPLEVLIPRGITGTTYDGIEYRDYADESYVKYDLDKAKAALQRYMDKKSITNPSSISLKFATMETSENKKMAESIQSHFMNDLGIDIQISVLPTTQYRNVRSNGEYDFVVYTWGPDYADPSSYIDIFTSPNIGSINIPRFNDPKFDQMVNDAAKVIEPEERMKAYADLEKYLIEENKAIIPFYQRNSPYFLKEQFTKYSNLFQLISDRYTEYKK